MYQNYRLKVESLRKGFIEESTSRKADEANRKRKSRWGDESEKVNIAQPGVLPVGQLPPGGSNNQIQRNPQLIQYAIQVFGSTDLEDSQWKQCEDQLKVGLHSVEVTAVCRIIKGFAFYSSKRPILRVIGGAEGVVPHPHNGGSK